MAASYPQGWYINVAALRERTCCAGGVRGDSWHAKTNDRSEKPWRRIGTRFLSSRHSFQNAVTRCGRYDATHGKPRPSQNVLILVFGAFTSSCEHQHADIRYFGQ